MWIGKFDKLIVVVMLFVWIFFNVFVKILWIKFVKYSLINFINDVNDVMLGLNIKLK